MLTRDGVDGSRTVAVAGAALELGATTVMERRLGPLLARPYRTGRAGPVLKAARVGTIAGALGALGALGAVASARARRRSRLLAAISALLLNAGSAATRYGVFEAGMVSVRDPEYTMVPQRERLEARAAGERAASAGQTAVTS